MTHASNALGNGSSTPLLDRRTLLRAASLGAGALAAAPALATVPAPLAKSRQGLDDLRLTEVRRIRLEFPGRTPRKWNSIRTTGGDPPGMSILELHTNHGIVGISFPKASQDFILSQVWPRIEGENPLYVERIWDRMYRHNRKPVAKGEYIEAMGSIDIAVWDIVGKALELPLYKILGGYTDRLRVYAAGGYYEEGKGINELVRELEGYVEQGFRAVKMKVAGAGFAEDLARVRAARAALGPEIDLLLDANNGWRAHEAIRFGRAAESVDPFWFEEPVETDNFAGCADVKRSLHIPVVMGENEYTHWGNRDLIVNDCVDILNFDTVKAGGLTGGRKIAALADAFHIPVAPHGDPFMAVHLVASSPNALILETYPGTASRFNPVLPLFPVKDGFIEVPKGPGLGIDLDPDAVRRYRVG